MHFNAKKSIFANPIETFNSTPMKLGSMSEKSTKHLTKVNIEQARDLVLKIFYFLTSKIVIQNLFPLHKALNLWPCALHLGLTRLNRCPMLQSSQALYKSLKYQQKIHDTKNAIRECCLIMPDANVELISLHQFASHCNSKRQLSPMREIVLKKR